MDQSRGERYALAGGLSVTVADLLREVHRAAGPPTGTAGGASDSLGVAAARARAAAAASSAIVARLLILEREAARLELPAVGRPEVVETGVTIVEGLDSFISRASLRATTAARAEAVSARKLWEQRSDPGAREIVSLLSSLERYVDQVAATFDDADGSDGSEPESA